MKIVNPGIVRIIVITGRAAGLALVVALLSAGCGAEATPTPAAPGLANTPTPGAQPDDRGQEPTVGTAPNPTSAPAATATLRSSSPTPRSPEPPDRPAPSVPPTPTDLPTSAPPVVETPVVAVPKEVIIQMGPGSVARYRVREQFARRNLPNDAVGETREVEGAIVLGANGAVVPDRSRITVNLRSLQSDDSDRDDYLETDALESAKFPLAEFVVEEAVGLPWPLPTSGELEFQLRGSMTLHGVTSPLVWDVMARSAPDGLSGLAETSFPFEKFDMERPSAFILLSVDNNIRLELEFTGALGQDG